MRRADRLFHIIQILRRSGRPVTAALGAQWVASHGDEGLARAARDLIAKIAVTVPENLRPLILDPAARTAPGWKIPADGLDVARARAWMRSGRKIALVYRDSEDRETERVLWPVVMGYLDVARMLIGWCELRKDFRSFRVDRVARATFLDERFPVRPAALRAKWLATLPKPQPAPTKQNKNRGADA